MKRRCGLGLVAVVLIIEVKSSSIPVHETPAIYLRAYEQNGDAASPPFVHALCYDKGGDVLFQAADCCRLLQDSIDNWASNGVESWGQRDGDGVYQQCLQEIIPIPTVTNTTHSQPTPRFSVWYRGAATNESALSSPSFLFQPSLPQVSSPGSPCNVWHASRDVDSKSLEYRRLDNPISRSSLDESSQNQWIAHVESNLTIEGGLHRELHHRLTMTTANPNSQAPTGVPKYASASFVLLIHLPSDLFVNVEDIFRLVDKGDKSSLNVSLVTPLAVIDQEEPSFASPPHTLLIQVHVRFELYPVMTTVPVPVSAVSQWEFVTKLHVRYPKPFAVTVPQGANFWLVQLPRPELVAASVTFNDNQHEVTPTKPIPVQHCENPNQQWPPLQLWVASGHQRDFATVLSVTVLVALVGALVMLRDIARASVWD